MYRTLMVYVEDAALSESRIRLAADLAERYDATLIGFSAQMVRPPFVAGGVIIEEETEADVTARLAEREGHFRRILGSERRNVEWRSTVAPPTEALGRHARGADLIVIGQTRAKGDGYDSLDPVRAILRAGRPMLVVPDDTSELRMEHVVIGWKDSREARRAVMDALPFLHEAARVTIVEVCGAGEEESTLENLGDIARYLEHHKIKGNLEVVHHRDKSDGEQLIELSRNEHADLLVTGAYGHSRLGEWVFGGVTRDLLASSPICCLMSH
jgi:nucleotide-binding universal stress UspA family protein